MSQVSQFNTFPVSFVSHVANQMTGFYIKLALG